MNDLELTPEEQWQNDEDERLEYEGYCNKIRQGLDNIAEKSGERAIWELVQNARDLCKNNQAHITIKLTNNSFIFTHHGKEFDYTSFRALVKQDSSKDRADANLVGQYGTGFMTTHAFNRMVYVSAPYAVKRNGGEISGYVQVKDFKLDRTKVDTPEGAKKMKEQLDQVKSLCKEELLSNIIDDETSFRYDLTPEQVNCVSDQLSSVIRLIPFVLIINEEIKKVEIINNKTKEHFIIKKDGKGQSCDIDSAGWQIWEEKVSMKDCNRESSVYYNCKSLKSDKGDVIIIPPFPKECGKVKDIPSLFLSFPLLGTENFGVNFVFHSKRFHPVESRNNIMLPCSTGARKEKGKLNEDILKEMTTVLMSFYAKDGNAHFLGNNMCEVSFPTTSEDEETVRFYKSMQEMWIENIPNWEILPIGNSYKSISDTSVKLLHPNFYESLDEENRKSYETILASYALLPKKADGNPYLMPSENLISWSETIDRWRCNRDAEFFISVNDVCNAIKTKSEDLYTFLMFLKDSGNEGMMSDYALLPNRKGELRSKKNLWHGNFMTEEVYELVNVVMGDDADKIYDSTFLDVCEVGEYTQDDLYKAISATISTWRTSSLESGKDLSQIQIDALMKFCSASSQTDFTNQRGRMMPILVDFYGKKFTKINIVKLRDEEEEFYKTAFNFLLDYTLYQISLRSSDWVKENKDWLNRFLTEYTSSKNEDRLKKLDDYGVIPNQRGMLCLKKDLHKNNGVPREMADIYKTLFRKDLYEGWIDEDFENLVTLTEDTPVDIANKIEKSLVADMKQESNERQFSKIVREIILRIVKSKEWENWFGQINEKKATYTFSMKSGTAQESLFSLMDLEDKNLERLAQLSELGNIEQILQKMEDQQKLEEENKARFNHLYVLGKHIEDMLRNRITSGLISVKHPTKDDYHTYVEDKQSGQDIIISVKKGEQWKEIFFVEVKSKWDFNEPAHMSTNQIKTAALHPDNYALCCVDLRKHKNKNLQELPEDDIVSATKVKMDIGLTLAPMLNNILNADKMPDDAQIKISDYRSNMSAAVFEKGEPFQTLIDKIESIVKTELEQ